MALAQKPDCEGVYYMLGRSLFAAGRYQEIADIADVAVGSDGAVGAAAEPGKSESFICRKPRSRSSAPGATIASR